jgi:hypothetical protein
MSAFRFPNPTNRTAIVGSTGSGKSQFATWLLSTRNIDVRPWVIIDPKGDDLIGELPCEEIMRGEKPPREPGLYVMRPLPGTDDAWLEQFLWQCWSQEDIGIYIDEGYMIPRYSKAFQALLTQGRSKNIEMIMLSQRPVRCHPMMFSESDYLVVFRLNKPQDRETMQDAMSMNINKRLPEYNSYWYDVGRDKGFTLKPAPDRDDIVEAFERYAKRRVRVL